MYGPVCHYKHLYTINHAHASLIYTFIHIDLCVFIEVYLAFLKNLCFYLVISVNKDRSLSWKAIYNINKCRVINIFFPRTTKPQFIVIGIVKPTFTGRNEIWCRISERGPNNWCNTQDPTSLNLLLIFWISWLCWQIEQIEHSVLVFILYKCVSKTKKNIQ